MSKLLAAVAAMARRGCQRLFGATSNCGQQVEDSGIPAAGPMTERVDADGHSAHADLYRLQLAGEWPSQIMR